MTAPIVSLGFGSWGSPALVVTLGFGIGRTVTPVPSPYRPRAVPHSDDRLRAIATTQIRARRPAQTDSRHRRSNDNPHA